VCTAVANKLSAYIIGVRQCSLCNKRFSQHVHLLAHQQHGRCTFPSEFPNTTPGSPFDSVLVRLTQHYAVSTRLDPRVEIPIIDNAPLPAGVNLKIYNPPDWILNNTREATMFINELGRQGFFNNLIDTAYKRAASTRMAWIKKATAYYQSFEYFIMALLIVLVLYCRWINDCATENRYYYVTNKI
jgi:hypothetical protein